MHCEACEPLLGAWRDRELGVGSAIPVGLHLAFCATCREDLRALSQLDALLRECDPAPGVKNAPTCSLARPALILASVALAAIFLALSRQTSPPAEPVAAVPPSPPFDVRPFASLDSYPRPEKIAVAKASPVRSSFRASTRAKKNKRRRTRVRRRHAEPIARVVRHRKPHLDRSSVKETPIVEEPSSVIVALSEESVEPEYVSVRLSPEPPEESLEKL